MARAWFFLVLLNSSSFSATRLSISCLTLASSSWERRTLFSSISRVASASSRAPWSSSFSCSSIRRCLSRAWMERPPSAHSSHPWDGSMHQTGDSCLSHTRGLPCILGGHHCCLHLRVRHSLPHPHHKDSQECNIFCHCNFFQNIFDLFFERNIISLLT